MKKKIKKLVVTLSIVTVLVVGATLITKALIDESNSVHIDSEEIENSTLIIGTHLIYLGAMSDEIYEVAEKSAADSSQYNRYYKSELSGGVWYDITDASSLEDISTSGIPVSNEVIDKLNMTHHTKSDGKTYDLLTGKVVSVYDIYSPYDLKSMEELSPIKLQVDNINANENKTDTDIRNISLINEFYQIDFTDKDTIECDENIAALQKYYEILCDGGEEAVKCSKVQSVMEKIDASRRYTIFNNLQIEAMDKLTIEITRNAEYEEGIFEGIITSLNPIDGEKIELDETTDSEDLEEEIEDGANKVDDFAVDDNILTAISDSISKIEESSNEYSAKMLEEGTTVLSKSEYKQIMLLIEYAKSGNYSKCDEQVNKLLYIDAVNDGIIKDPANELSYIEGELITEGVKEYRAQISKGVCAEYKKLPSTAANVTKQNVLKNQKAEAEKGRTQLQFIIQAKIDRMDNESSIEYLKELINGSNDYMNSIKKDAYESYAKSSVESYVQWLNEKITSIQKTLGTGEMDALVNKKEELQEQKLEALDKENLSEAKRLDAEIEAVDKSISDLEKELNNIINSDTATEAEKAAAKAALGAGTASSTINQLANDAIADIKNGDYDDVSAKLQALGEFADTNPKSAMSALKDVYNTLSSERLMNEGDSEALDNLLTETENVVAENVGIYTSDLSQSDMEKLINAYFDLDEDLSIEDLLGGNNSGGEAGKTVSDSEKAQILAAIGMYASEGDSENAKNILDKYLGALEAQGNIHIFRQYSVDASNTYIGADVLARLIGYRYIFNDSQKKVIIQNKGKFYEFNAFDVNVRISKEDEVFMDYPTGYQKVLYIPGEYALSEFNVLVYYIEGTEYAIALDRDQMDKAGELFDYLLEAGGRK